LKKKKRGCWTNRETVPTSKKREGGGFSAPKEKGNVPSSVHDDERNSRLSTGKGRASNPNLRKTASPLEKLPKRGGRVRTYMI